MLAYIFAFTMGIFCELVAAKFGLWQYKKPYYPALNILLVFTAIFGSCCWLLAYVHPLFVVSFAGVIGIAYEWLNLRVLTWWEFPPGGIGPLTTATQLLVGVGLAWAGIPLTWLAIINF